VRTGAGFDYLVQTAFRESAMDSTASARRSSAVGLFQFVENTWMETVKETGPRNGLGEAAAAIEKTADGRYEVADPKTRAAILALRTVPEAAALMAGELTRANAGKLEAGLGRPPTDGELYIAHFLGASGASDLIRLAAETPAASAAQQFPAAARANPSIFHTRDGHARTVAGVYRNLVARHQAGPLKAVAAAPLDLTPDRARAGLAPRRPAGTDGAPPVAVAYAGPSGTYLDLYRHPAGGNAREALVATMKAYGIAPAGQSAPPAATGRRPWGGSLFSTSDVRPVLARGSLFSTGTGGG